VDSKPTSIVLPLGQMIHARDQVALGHMLVLRDLSRRYGGKSMLRGLTDDVAPGRRHGGAPPAKDIDAVDSADDSVIKKACFALPA